MATRKKKSTIPKQRRGEAVEPVMTLRLMEVAGPGKAAKLMGTTTTTLHRARNKNEISPVFEIAAKGALREYVEGVESKASTGVVETYRQPGMAAARVPDAPRQVHDGHTAFILEVSPDRAEMVREFAKMVKAKILEP